MDLQRRRWLRLGAALAVTGTWSAWPAQAWAGTPADEPGTFSTRDLEWIDARRQRAVPARLYLPQAAHAVPLLVFSHGIGGSRLGYTWLGQHVARHGIASLHLQHVGSDRQLWSGNIFNLVGRLQAAARDSEAMARAQDVRFALDMLLTGELAPRFDAERIVAAGHSYGANTTLLVSGASVERAGRPVALRDERVRAAIAISAPPFYGEAEPREILRQVQVPSLHVTCTDDVIRIPGYYSGAEDRLAVFDAIGSPRKWLAVYEGGSHGMFTDRTSTGGALNLKAKQATAALAVAFVRAVLDGQAQALAAWPERHADILALFAAVGTAPKRSES